MYVCPSECANSGFALVFIFIDKEFSLSGLKQNNDKQWHIPTGERGNNVVYYLSMILLANTLVLFY